MAMDKRIVVVEFRGNATSGKVTRQIGKRLYRPGQVISLAELDSEIDRNPDTEYTTQYRD